MVAAKIRIAKPTLGVQLKRAVDLRGLTETPVKLGREGAADLIRREADIAAGRSAPARLLFLPQPWHHVSMRPLTITLCLLATPALADVAGVASVKGEALAAYAEHLLGIVA